MTGLVGGGGDKGAAKAAQAQLESQRLETQRMRDQAEQEKRDLAEQQASKRMARARGGNRLLLAEERLNPEAGIEEQTLGAA
jgi:microcystin degradation protein MlrC